MMHDVTMTRKIKEQTNLIMGFFRAVTIDTTNNGSRPEIHGKPRGGVNYRIFMHRVDLRDTTNKDSCSLR